MRKIMSLALLLTFILPIILGCQSDDQTTLDADKTNSKQQMEANTKTDSENNEKNQQSEEDIETLELEGEMIKINVSKWEENDTIVFKDDKSIETFNTIFTSAVKADGIVNMTSPEFKINIFYANEIKQYFYLWLGDKGETSILMNTDDTHIIYDVSEEMTDKLNDLIK